jgi:hypothetical protein
MVRMFPEAFGRKHPRTPRHVPPTGPQVTDR